MVHRKIFLIVFCPLDHASFSFGVAKRHRYRLGYRGRFGDSVIAHTGTREKFSRMGMVATDVFFALEQWG